MKNQTYIRADAPLQRAFAAAGGLRRLADMLKLKPSSLSAWERVPVNRVVDVERLTGIPRDQLRPDIFRYDATPPPPAGAEGDSPKGTAT